jgi:tetratricopeptide (TPR) repeat protein
MRTLRVCFAALLIFGCGISLANAAGPDTSFEAANRFYEQGHYSEAAASYEKIIAAGQLSEAVYFNLGDAYYKMGQSGRAIAAWRKAQYLDPRDPDVRVNLQFARNTARGGVPDQAGHMTGFFNLLALNEWSWLALVSFSGVFIVLAAGQLRPAAKLGLQRVLYCFSAALVFFGLGMAVRLNADVIRQTAIVISGEADVRNGPLDESQSLFKVRDGMELEIMDQDNGWFKVADSSARSGWVRQDQVIRFELPVAKK